MIGKVFGNSSNDFFVGTSFKANLKEQLLKSSRFDASKLNRGGGLNDTSFEESWKPIYISV